MALTRGDKRYIDQKFELVVAELNDLRENFARSFLALFRHLRFIEQKEGQEMALIDDLLAEVGRNTTVSGSVLALVQKLIDQSGGDPVKLQQALDTLRANDDQVAAKVLENTPQETPTE